MYPFCCAFSYVSSGHLDKMIHDYTDCISLTYLHHVFSHICAKEEVKRPEGLQLEVGAQRAPRLLVLHNFYLYLYLASVSASHMVDRLAETPLGRENESIKQDMHDVHKNIYPCHIFMMCIYCQDMHDVHISPSAIICFTVVLL